MKTWEQIIDHTFEQKKTRNWDKLYWAIDLHDTVITGRYNKFNHGAELFPYAKETLDLLYHSDLHKTILWTSSHDDAIEDIIKRHELKFHYINSNPECPNSELCNFQSKFYFNFLIDDKSGFHGQYDWLEIHKALQKHHK